MDRLHMQIPRNLLDLFVDYSINKGLFNQREEITMTNDNYDNDKSNSSKQNVNKFDEYDYQAQPEYEYYFSRRNHFRERGDLNQVIDKFKIGLKVDAKPFFPKKREDHEDDLDDMKKKLAEMNPNNVKEYVPKKFEDEKAKIKLVDVAPAKVKDFVPKQFRMVIKDEINK